MIKSVVKSVVSSVVVSLLGGGAISAEAALDAALEAEATSGDFVAQPDLTDLTSIFQADGSGNPSIGDSIDGATVLDTSQFGGKTAAEFIAGQPEALTNHDGSSGDLTGWSESGGGDWVFANGRFEYGAHTANSNLQQDVLIVGEAYLVSMIHDSTSGNLYLRGFGVQQQLSSSVVSGRSYIMTASQTLLQVHGNNAAATGEGFSSLSIKHLPGNHTTASGTGPTVLDTFDPSAPALTDNGGRGEELVENGDFATGDLTGFSTRTLGSGVLGYPQVVAGAVQVIRDGSDQVQLYQDLPVEIGATYEVTATADDGAECYIGNGGFTEDYGGVATASGGEISRTIRVTATSIRVVFNAPNDATAYNLDNISVRKVLTAFDERGPELVTSQADREFTSDTGFWSVSGGSISSGRLDLSTTSDVAITSALGLTSGDVVEIEFENVGTGTVIVYAGVNSSSGDSAQTKTGTGVHKVILAVGSDYDGVRFGSGASTGILIDNVSIKKVLTPNLVTNGTFDADSDWTKGANTTIGSGVLSVNSAGAGYTSQALSLSDNAWYLVRAYVTVTTGTATLNLGGNHTPTISATGWVSEYVRNGTSNNDIRFSPAGGFTGTVDNVSVQEVPASIARTLYVETNGTDDKLTLPLPASGPDLTSMSITMAVRTSDTQGMLVNGDGSSRYLGTFFDGSSATSLEEGAGSPSYRLDGASFAPSTRDDFHTDLADGNWHVVTINAADLSSWGDIILGYFGVSNAWNADADYAFFSIYPNNTATRDLAEAAAADAIKETGYALAA